MVELCTCGAMTRSRVLATEFGLFHSLAMVSFVDNQRMGAGALEDKRNIGLRV